MQRNPRIQLLSTELLHQGRVLRLVRERLRLPSGLEQDLVLVDHPGAVCIAPREQDGRLVLVRQYRHATGDWLLELPAGRLEAGEERLASARRELEEETGLRASSLRLLHEFYPAPGFCSEWMSLYLAEGLESAGADRLAHDFDEEFELVRLHPAQVLEQCHDAKTLLAAALLLRS